ncbi:sugar ABC transporter substrate-binding protein [Streptococcus agalactiae]|nr:Sugar ABC transporter substrate-binding protein [Streptococcus agalactiae]EJZ03967.1 sugar ABC transporter sugar-binding protein [Streptococcus agalactiae STIR-CD-17]EPU02102.1 sugar ABC transporter substrate-binding protein [Streptococcus agalactiae STIR-CD-13]EPU03820.1 sugar ABC transporter substrate-binding protein [Streptococcus agalactiae STIR-CD-09]EPW81326.1 sugar ABC transporter substrate-binding protein [Streptococcus agalactiae STIR-CD-07]
MGYYMGLAAACLALLAGCSNNSNKESKASDNKSGTTEISYAIWDSAQEPGIRKIADKFEEKNPKIKVKIQVVSWDAYWTMLEAGATGGSYPDETWDWNKLKEAAKKLTKPDGSQYGFLAPFHNQEGYYNFVYQNGGTIITKDKKSGYNDPKTVEALKYYLSFVKENLSPKVTEDKKRAEVMQNGQAAMGYFGSWNLNSFASNDYMKENFDVAVLPKANDGKRSTIFNGLGNAISAKTKHPQAAWKWVEYLSSKEAQDMQAKLGVAISAYKGSDKIWVDSNKTFAIKHFVEMIDYAQIRPYSNATTKWEDKVYEELKPAYLGKESLEKAVKKITKTMNRALEREK